MVSTFAMDWTSVILYAKWSPTYTVTYNGNGNTGGIVPQDSTRYFANNTVTLLGNTGTLTKSGYVFGGWNTEANGTGTNQVAASTFTMGTTNIVLYAIWRDYYVVGDTGPAGGFIFYDKGYYSAGWRYMEATPSDHAMRAIWPGLSGNIATGATATGIESGSANTTTIVSVHGVGMVGSYAALLYKDLVLGGYDVWFLPSKDELTQLNVSQQEAGYSNGNIYTWFWSSSEFNEAEAWEVDIASSGGYQQHHQKSNFFAVRAVRAF